MRPSKFKCQYIWLDEVDSTNRYAKDHFADLNDPSFIVANLQTAGKGRRGRKWLSPPNVNLYVSFVIKRWPYPPHQATWLASLATLDALRNHAPRLDIWVKWPNDVFCGRKKIAGVLCETIAPGSSTPGIILGVGVNVNMPENLLVKIDQPATSVLNETKRCVNLKNLAFALGNILTDLYSTAFFNGMDAIFSLWKRENRLIGKEVEVLTDKNESLNGRVLDITPVGELALQDNRDNIHRFNSGDIKLKW